MKKLFRIISIISIVIVSALLALSLMSFKNGSPQNLDFTNRGTDLKDISAPKPNKPGTSTTTSSEEENTAGMEYIYIDAKGTGDYETLEDAIINASEGSTVILDSGTYNLAEFLEIDKSINLIGTGPDKTVITGEIGGSVIYINSEVRFFAEGIAFSRKGKVPGDIIDIEKGDASFNNCLFSGGKPNPEEDNWGIGLYYYYMATGTVSNCVAESNSFCGIAIEEDAKITLINNIFRKNSSSGISYYGSGGGYAIKNECYSNGVDGIQVQLNSIPTLINNKCHDNKECGISYYEESGGMAFRNECTKNLIGIYISETAFPLLEANTLKNNSDEDLMQESE